MDNFDVLPLPNGKFIVSRREPRPGFTVPKAVLVGIYDSMEEANAAIRAAKAQDHA